MATISLSLKTPKEKTSVIWAILSDGRDYKIKLYPGWTVSSKHWSRKNRCVTSSNPDAVIINRDLGQFRSDILDIYLKAKNSGLVRKVKKASSQYEYFPKADHYKKELEKLRLSRSEIGSERPTFWELWGMFLESKKGEFKLHSFKKFGSLKNHLETFEKTSGKLEIDHITQELLEELQKFFYYSRNLNTQSTAKYIGLFKIFLNWCVKRKHTTNIDFRQFRPIRQPESLKVIIDSVEMDLIRKLDLTGKPHLKNVRELFILSCLTGLRYSDYTRIDKQHFKQDPEGTPILQIRQQKTDDFVEIPLTPEAESIVKRLIAEKIHPISNQKMNSYVKDLCKLAEVNEEFEVHKYQGRNKTSFLVPKYNLITTHTGRRTFATNLLNRGVPAEIVMQFTGHRDYKSFAAYVNIPKKAQMETVKKALLGNTKLRVA